MSINSESKQIKRDVQASTKIFDNRSLETDYKTLKPILKEGMSVLDVGCGTGTISIDVANFVGELGKVIGIDISEEFIESGKQSHKDTSNLELIAADIFKYTTEQKFDLIICARTMQWLSNPKDVLIKMKSMLKPEGIISILDYSHKGIEWNPEPSDSVKEFYKIFLKWREDAGMDNGISESLPKLMEEVGLKSIEKINSDEHYERSSPDFIDNVGKWINLAGSTQMVEEGYINDDLRKKAMSDFIDWVSNKAVSMTMKMNEVRGVL